MSVRSARSRAKLRPAAVAALFSASLTTLAAASAHGQIVPALQHSAVSLGQQRPSTPISGTVWLPLHNKAALDAAVEAMYTPGSPTFQKFAGPEALAQFAPTAAEVESVKKELAAHNLKVVNVNANNFSIKIQGQTSDFEAAFHTTVNQYRTKSGATVSALATPPALSNGAAGLVRAVTGITSKGMQPYILHPVDPDTGKQTGVVPVASSPNPDGAYYSSECFYAPNIRSFSGSSGGADITASYYGVLYGANFTNQTPGTVNPCGYSPQDEYRLAGLDTVYGQGYTGKGQTIVIVDAYGSPTIDADLATFNSIYHLPKATSSNFRVIEPVPVTGANAGWAEETTLDVEWSHAIAPDANIVLIATPTNSNDDLEAGVLYAIQNHLANVISNSYGLGELESDSQTITSWDELCELGAFQGISINFATGDSGDLKVAESGTVPDVSSPADSPYATAVGGTSAAFNPVDGSVFQTGWGTNITRLATPTTVYDPPQVEGFLFGAGGGTSQFFKKPSYQNALSGTSRQLPDVSALADPYTAAEIIFTANGAQSYVAVGGTSLATPIFSAEWALLDQRFGFPLGQAAPYIAQYANNSSVVTDVTAPSPQFSTQGLIVQGASSTAPAKQTYYSAEALAAPETNTPFLGTIYQTRRGNTYDLTFGTDSSLPISQGWDPVTGWGTLNMNGIFTTPAK